jgi:hypothetical protein
MKIIPLFAVLFALSGCSKNKSSHMVNPDGLDLQTKSGSTPKTGSSEQNPNTSAANDPSQTNQPATAGSDPMSKTIGGIISMAGHLFAPAKGAVPVYRCINRKGAAQGGNEDPNALLQGELFKKLAEQGKAIQCIEQMVEPAIAGELLKTIMTAAQLSCTGEQEFKESTECDPPKTGLQFMGSQEQNLGGTQFKLLLRMTYSFSGLSAEELELVKTGLKTVQLPTGGDFNLKFDLTPDLK